jgi:hypothetical protein
MGEFLNILVSLLRTQPDIVDSLLSEGSLRGIQLYTTRFSSLNSDLAILSESVQVIASNPEFLDIFQSSYIPEMKVGEWEVLLDRATPWDPSKSPQLPAEWVTFVSGYSRPDLGLLLPDDGTPDARLSTFTVVGRERRFLGLSITPDWQVARTTVSNSHCSPPDENGCGTGNCRQCRLRRIQTGDTVGILCKCPH